jgi:alanyl-tRNA synthetase
VDTQKKDQTVLHHVEILKGQPKTGDEVTAVVDRNRRERAMRNHTATHLLHAALRNILGTQVRQLGSLVAPEKLRFDYSYAKPLTPDQLKQIEDSVNSEILKDTALTKEEKPTEDAKKDGAIAFFGEKYGDRVRVVSVPGFSKEFCGGTHCDRTGQIGAFVITGDSSIASGVRRMEAVRL